MNLKPAHAQIVELARRQFESTGRVTMDHLHSSQDHDYTRKTIKRLISRFRAAGLFPWPVTRTDLPELHPNHARLIEAARVEFESTGGTTTARLLAATGYTPNTLLYNVRLLRGRGLFPWVLDGKSHVAITRDDREAVAARARAFAVRAVAHLRDGRAEVDDPREHGWLAEPRSVHREAPPDLAEVCRGFVAEHRRILRRQRAGHRRELVGAAPPTARSRGPPGRRGCPQTDVRVGRA